MVLYLGRAVESKRKINLFAPDQCAGILRASSFTPKDPHRVRRGERSRPPEFAASV